MLMDGRAQKSPPQNNLSGTRSRGGLPEAGPSCFSVRQVIDTQNECAITFAPPPLSLRSPDHRQNARFDGRRQRRPRFDQPDQFRVFGKEPGICHIGNRCSNCTGFCTAGLRNPTVFRDFRGVFDSPWGIPRYCELSHVDADTSNSGGFSCAEETACESLRSNAGSCCVGFCAAGAPTAASKSASVTRR